MWYLYMNVFLIVVGCFFSVLLYFYVEHKAV